MVRGLVRPAVLRYFVRGRSARPGARQAPQFARRRLASSHQVPQPREVTATAGYDAISHAVESYVTTRRTAASIVFAREAWQLLAANFERVLRDPCDLEARGAMLLGAHYAGIALENPMLGAPPACANPLTAHYRTAH